MSFESGGGQRFPYTYSQVFEGLLRTLPNNGFKIKSHDKDVGRIECSSGMSLLSWGENVAISVEEIDPYSTRVAIGSGLKLQGTRQAIITGEGKNAKNISLIVSALSAYLKTQKKPEKAIPPAQPSTPTPPPRPMKPVSFYVYVSDEVKGPFSATQLDALLKMKSITSTTPCCPEGSNDWRTVTECLG